MLRAATLLPHLAPIVHTRRLHTAAIAPRGITTLRRTGVTLHRVRTLRLRAVEVLPHRAVIRRRALQVEASAADRIAEAAADPMAAEVGAGSTVEAVALPTAAGAITNSGIL